MNSGEIETLLAQKFAAPQYAFFEQVGNGTGGRKTRTADGLAMGIWPSRGMHLSGFEIKVSRSDWLNELKQPQKADEVACYCDFWWLVVSEAKIVQLGELPATWGLMACDGGKIKVLKEPLPLDPKPINRTFLAAFLRRIVEDFVPRHKLQELAEARSKAIAESQNTSSRYMLERIEGELRDLKKTVLDFEVASGIAINRWCDSEKLGAAVKVVMHHGVEDQLRKLKAFRNTVASILSSTDEGIAAFQPTNPTPHPSQPLA